MKLSLPSFLNRKKSADDEPVSKPMPQLTGDIKPASLGKIRFQLLLAGVALLGVLAAFILQLMSGPILRATEQESKIITQQVALRGIGNGRLLWINNRLAGQGPGYCLSVDGR